MAACAAGKRLPGCLFVRRRCSPPAAQQGRLAAHGCCAPAWPCLRLVARRSRAPALPAPTPRPAQPWPGAPWDVGRLAPLAPFEWLFVGQDAAGERRREEGVGTPAAPTQALAQCVQATPRGGKHTMHLNRAAHDAGCIQTAIQQQPDCSVHHDCSVHQGCMQTAGQQQAARTRAAGRQDRTLRPSPPRSRLAGQPQPAAPCGRRASAGGPGGRQRGTCARAVDHESPLLASQPQASQPARRRACPNGKLLHASCARAAAASRAASQAARGTRLVQQRLNGRAQHLNKRLHMRHHAPPPHLHALRPTGRG